MGRLRQASRLMSSRVMHIIFSGVVKRVDSHLLNFSMLHGTTVAEQDSTYVVTLNDTEICVIISADVVQKCNVWAVFPGITSNRIMNSLLEHTTLNPGRQVGYTLTTIWLFTRQISCYH